MKLLLFFSGELDCFYSVFRVAVSHDDFKYDVTDDSPLSTFVMYTSVNAASIIFLVSHSFHFDKISFHSFSHLFFLLDFLTNDFVKNI